MPASTSRTTPRKSAPQITSAAAWASSEANGVVTELPSGKIVLLVRKLDLPTMLKSGRIPNPLAKVVQGMISSGKKEMPEELTDPQVFEQMMSMVDTSVSAAMVEPKAIVPPVWGKNASGIAFPESEEEFGKRVVAFENILADPQANTISTDWIDLEDKMFIFFFSQGGAADLATFRSATTDAMARLSTSGAVEGPSE